MTPSLPLHPAVIHFPIAAAFFAAAALALAHLRPGARAASLAAAVLLLGVAVAGGLAALVTGWRWADELAYLAGGFGPVPGPQAVEGLARRRGGSPLPALLATLLACALVGAAGHAGGTMVHRPPAAGR